MEKWLCKFLDKLSSELTKIAVTKVKLIGPFIMIYDTSGNIYNCQGSNHIKFQLDSIVLSLLDIPVPKNKKKHLNL